MSRAIELMQEADREGMAVITGGVFLQSQENIIANQATWDDMDTAKHEDFTTAAYWITTDNGEVPEGIRTESELATWLMENMLDVRCDISKAASIMGRKGRAVNSPAQQDAARANGAKGGRPKKNQAE